MIKLCRPCLLATTALVCLGASPAEASDQDSTYEARISELEAKVARLEALLVQQAGEPEHADATNAYDAAVPKRTASLVGETEIVVGGYMKLDASLSDYSKAPTRGAGEDYLIPATIRTSGEPAESRMNIHAKETRLWVKSLTPTDRGDLSTYLEADFMLSQQGDERVGNNYAPRLRQAVIRWERWTFGQTWTNFFNASTLPAYLDFVGPVSTIFGRQAQIRYTAATANGHWSISLENPETTLTPYLGGPRIVSGDSGVPDLVMRRDWRGDWGNFSIAGLVRKLQIDRPQTSDSAIGGAVSLAGKLTLYTGDDFRWQANFGNGLGRYMGQNSYNGGTLNAANEIELTTQYGAHAAYRRQWSERFSSSLGLSFSAARNDSAISGLAAAASYRSLHADIVWSPVERMSIGAEYIYAYREDEGGDTGTLNRLQFSAKYLY